MPKTNDTLLIPKSGRRAFQPRSRKSKTLTDFPEIKNTEKSDTNSLK